MSKLPVLWIEPKRADDGRAIRFASETPTAFLNGPGEPYIAVSRIRAVRDDLAARNEFARRTSVAVGDDREREKLFAVVEELGSVISLLDSMLAETAG